MEENKNEEKKSKSVSTDRVHYVEVNDKVVAVRKLGLLSYTTMMSSFQDIIDTLIKTYQYITNPDIFKSESNMTPEKFEELSKKFSSTLKDMLVDNFFNVIKFLDIAIPELGYEYICEEVGLNDALDLLDEVIKVNKFEEAGPKIKNMIRGLLVSDLKRTQKKN